MPRFRRPQAELTSRAHDLIWAEIRRVREFTSLELEQATKITRGQLENYTKRLVLGGFLTRTAETPGVLRSRLTYRLVLDPGAEAPRLGADGTPSKLRRRDEQIWRAMKTIGRDFGILDIADAVATADPPISEAHVKSYIPPLARAGYLQALNEHPNPLMVLYRFDRTRNTGKLPPIIESLGVVYDQNTKRVVRNPEPQS
jgi:hypothetical protein